MEPRPGHYEFAHRLLPILVLERWEEVRPTFQDGSATERLRTVWGTIRARQADAKEVSGEAISVAPVVVGGEPAFLVRLPEPKGVTEALFAIVPDRPAPTRYFVLELGQQVQDGQPRWVLCEWQDGRHLNEGSCGDYAAGAEAVREAMIERVGEILGRSAGTGSSA